MRAFLMVMLTACLSLGMAAGCSVREHADSPDAGRKDGAASDQVNDHGLPSDVELDESKEGSGAPDVPTDLATDETGIDDGGPPDLPSCPSDKHQCPGNAACVALDSLTACGSSCAVCAAPTGGTATCDGRTCDFNCGSLKKCAATQLCVPTTGCCDSGDCPVQAGGKVGTCDTSTHTCNYDCAADMTACNGACLPKGGCCVDKDCAGACQKCSNHVCTGVIGQDDPNGRCSGTCDSSGKCKSKQGQQCASPTAEGCLAGTTCMDGFCCDKACGGSCQACDVRGLEGTCSPVLAGGPHGSRSACSSDGSTCGGRCAGRTDGQCQFPTGTCGSATCSGSDKYVAASACQGGSCVAPTGQICPNGLACAASACKSSCSKDADCQSGYACSGSACLSTGSFCDQSHPCSANSYCNVAGACVPKKQNGDGCSTNTECLTAICIDGVCCNQACDGSCLACDVAGLLGMCSPVPSGKPHGARSACPTDGSSCGGHCGGRIDGQCAFSVGSCGSATCSGTDRLIAAGSCQGGSCVSPAAQLCLNGLACSSGACKSSCSKDTDCQAGYSCSGATCLPTGSFCDQTHPCSGTNYCNPGGTCVPKKQNGDGCSAGAECTLGICIDGVCCNRACDGACEACNLTGSSGQCGPVTSRDDDHCNGQQTCDGSGGCKKKSGQVCGGGSECASGSCVDGHCCSKSACGTCQACTGTAGTCVAVKSAEDDTCKKENFCDAGGACISRFTEYPVAKDIMPRITTGPDMNIWFSKQDTKIIAKMSTSGTLVEYSIPRRPFFMTSGSDGAMWFTTDGHTIARITVTGLFSEFLPYSLPNDGIPLPNDIASGPDGNLWITDVGGRIVKMTPAGTTTVFPADIGDDAGTPQMLVAGPDGNLWFTLSENFIGRISTSGTIVHFPIPFPPSLPGLLAATIYVARGGDGNVWFTEPAYNQIARISPAGVVKEFSIPTPNSHPTGLTAGADGNMWFAENEGRQIARISPSGTVTEYLTPSGFPNQITTGADGNIWFTDSATKIVRFVPP